MKNTKNDYWFRRIALFATILNILFNYSYALVTQSATVSEVTSRYQAQFNPAPDTFSIWGLIYLSLLIYSVVQVSRSQRRFSVYDRLSVPVLLINALLSAWIIFYTQNYIGVSVFILLLTLYVSYYAFRKAYLAVQYRDYNLWLQFPFSLLAGWLTVAVVSDLYVYLHYLGWTMNMGEGTFTIVSVIALTIAAVVVSARSFSLVFPAAICWGIIRISLKNQNESPQIATLALSSAILILVASFAIAIFRKIKNTRGLHHEIDF